MSFFSWREINQISKLIGCDSFAKKNVIRLDDFDREVEEERFTEKRQQAEEEPDLERFEIRMHKQDELVDGIKKIKKNIKKSL